MKKTTPKDRLIKLQNMLSKFAGVNIEVTIRGERSFTFSFEGQNETALQKIVSYLKKGSDRITYLYDSESDLSAIYLEV